MIDKIINMIKYMKKYSMIELLVLATVVWIFWIATSGVFYRFRDLGINWFGESTSISVLAIEPIHHIDQFGNSFIVDRIIYSFKDNSGHLFTGISELNESETSKLLGKKFIDGTYPEAQCRYISKFPKYNKLINKNYNSFSNNVFIVFTLLIALLIIYFIIKCTMRGLSLKISRIN